MRRFVGCELLPCSSNRIGLPKRTGWPEYAESIPAAASASELTYGVVKPVEVQRAIIGIFDWSQKRNFRAVVHADFRHLLGISRQDDNVEHARIESGRDCVCEEWVTVKNAGVL